MAQPGSVTISGTKAFRDFERKQASEVFTLKKRKTIGFSFLMNGPNTIWPALSAEEYPVFVEPEDVPLAQLDGEILREMINKTIYSVTLEEAGFKLSGIFTEKVVHEGKTYLRMVSTDGHRLSLIEKEIKDIEKIKLDGGVMIPKKGMVELANWRVKGESFNSASSRATVWQGRIILYW